MSKTGQHSLCNMNNTVNKGLFQKVINGLFLAATNYFNILLVLLYNS